MDRKIKKWKEKFISLVLTVALVMAGMPIEPLQSVFRLPAGIVHADVVYEDVVGADWSSGTVYNIFNPDYLVKYSQAYYSHAENHQHDTLVIAFGEGASSAPAEEFLAIGTETYPFKGTIKISSVSANVLNLPDTFFDYVYDSVQIIDSADGSGENAAAVSMLQITRINNNVGAPILAKHVRHDADGGEAQNWKVKVAPYNDGTNINQYNFGGIIGEMETNARLKLDVEDISTGVVYGTDNAGVGYLCGSMAEGSSLTVQSISGSNTEYSVTGTAGHAGGLVGNMASGAVLTMQGSALNTSAVVSTTAVSSYAGGLVGCNDGGTIVFDRELVDLPYPVQGTVSGTAGTGGIFGYYKTTGEVSLDVDVSQYKVDVTVNGTGSVGGLFGVLNNAGGSVEIIALGENNKTVTAAHSDGSADHYGGLIGKYTARALADSLTVGNVTASVSKSGGSYSYYGGGIGQIDGVAYVKFDGFTASASGADTLTFGGLVAGADSAFVDAKDVTVSASDFKGGGVVGSLANGVLRLSGTTNLAGAKSSTDNNTLISSHYRMGQIVGYRDNALVFAANGWELTRSTTAVEIDDIGSWGEVIRFNASNLTETSVMAIDLDAHTIVIGTPKAAINDLADYARAALGMQIDDSSNAIVGFYGTSYTDLALASTSITLAGDINLTDTGLNGLTRDNVQTDSDSADKCVFSGTFNGGGHTVTFAIGDRPGTQNDNVYRHIYSGLFGIADGATIQSVIFDGAIHVKANRGNMYVGAVAARAKGSFSATGVTVRTTFSHAGGSTLYLGGILGEATSGINSISVSNSKYDGIISGNASSDNCCIAGMLGRISHANNKETRSWSFDTIELSGIVSNTSGKHSQMLGGLVAYIEKYTYDYRSPQFADRNLNLNGITVNGLTVSGAVKHNGRSDDFTPLTSGGLLGYAWYNTNVNVEKVAIKDADADHKATVAMTVDSPTNNAGYGDTAGLVYAATGHWIVTSLNIDHITVNADSAKSFGMIVNKGWFNGGSDFYDNKNGSHSAIYMELPVGYTYTIANAALPAWSADIVYDELVAYSAYYHENQGDRTTSDGALGLPSDITKNGQGIVSIHTGLTMDDGLHASGSYQAQTVRGAIPNPYTRYYYNLDTVTKSNADELTVPQMQLMSWGVNQYACVNLKQYFANPFTNNVITTASYDMTGYSWYPVDVDTEVTVQGTFVLKNKEFENSESSNGGTNSSVKTSLYDTTYERITQHYLMHAGLFHNVHGVLNVGALALQGTIGAVDDSLGSGALVCGYVEGRSSTDLAQVLMTDEGAISLDGIEVWDTSVWKQNTSSDYAPLLINQARNYATLLISNVSTTTAYKTGESTKQVATSLIGNAGVNASSKNISVMFSGIKLDGRSEENIPAQVAESVYHTTRSIFTKATLLNKFQYDSGSSGVYNYTKDEDWGSGNRNVTYGREVGYTTADTETEFGGEEQWYSGEAHDGGYYTNAVDGTTITDAYSSTFKSAFLPYVAVAYNAQDKTHQIKVNHGTAAFTGCGTYNDPYIISTGKQLETIASILQGNEPADKYEIGYNTSTWCTGHSIYQYSKTAKLYYLLDAENNATETSIDSEKVRTHLAGAYYKLGEDIELSADFVGLGVLNNASDKFAVFRGIIYGDGHKITNKSNQPLICTSYGSVVKYVDIIVAASITKNQTQKSTFTEGIGCENYGAVIGQILGGDNIIDEVTVTFSDTTSITLSGNYAQLVPVGGYVGVVVNGALIFKGMESKRGTTAIQGIPESGTIVTDGTDTNLVSETNKKWLYVNPVIGRVLNGYAVTEGDAYRPFEDTSREGYNEALSVTMKNGNKNYSIADIDDSLDMLYVGNYTDITGLNGNYKKTNVEIPNAQAMFVLSVLIQSSVTTTMYNNSGKKYRLENGTSFDSAGYKMTRRADYVHVGNVLNAEDLDYVESTKDSGDVSTYKTIPYIIANYTEQIRTSESTREDKYGVFCLTHSYTVCDIKLTNADANELFYLPDGFRGIGNLAFNEMTGNVLRNHTVSLYEFDGNQATIGVHMNYDSYEYGFDNYSQTGQERGTGFGLFNTLRQNRSDTGVVNLDADSYKIHDFTLKGDIHSKLIDHTTGITVVYTTTNNVINRNEVMAVGGIIGYAGMLQKDTLNFDNVRVSSLTVEGIKYTGGFIGYHDTNWVLSAIQFNNCCSDKLNVLSGYHAGGVIGRLGYANLTIKGENSIFKVESVLAECVDGWFCVGGLVGSSEKGGTYNIEDITIGDKGASGNAVIGSKTTSNNARQVGGIIGSHDEDRIFNLIVTDCNIYNLDIEGGRTGGIIGNSERNKDNTFILTNTHIIGNGTSEIRGVYAGDRGTGGFIGNLNCSGTITIDNCSIENYIICNDENIGGFIGKIKDRNSLYATINLRNSKLDSCVIKSSKTNVGGIFGQATTGTKSISGYNLLFNNLQFQNDSGALRVDTNELCGSNYPVKIVGMSVQGSGIQNNIMKNVNVADGGYIIFADYNGRSLSESTRGLNRSDIYSGTNVSQTGSDNFPYVTSSPKCGIAPTQFLTGDGVSAWTYNASAVNQIITDLQAQTQPARAYKNAYAAVTEDDLNLLVSTLSTNGKYTGYQAEMGSQAGVSTNYNFPVIVIDDTNKETTTTLINTYLRLLTNTDYDFAKGTLADGTTSAASIFSVALGKCTFNSTENKFDVTFDSSCLLNTDGQHFYMGSTYDTSNPNGQFSLIDVKFFDPADTSKVAYHLHVPVLVKKMMLYDFSASILSGTNYRMDAYTTRGNSLIENLGNPVTMEARYTYRQSEAEWIAAINAGESVLRTYDKKLRVTDHTGSGLPAGTRMILIDANQNNKFYTATLAETEGVYTTGDNNYLDLNRFKDESNSAFKSVLFNDFFDITATENAEGSFDLVTGCSTEEEYIAAGATVRDNSGNYYKLHDESEEGKGAYSLSVSYKSGVSDENGYIQEDYYLTFYTQAAENTIYHLEFSAPVSFGSTLYPSRMRTQYPTHLFTGDIYEETFEITDPSSGTEISLEGNNRIGATFTSRVKLKDTAGPTIVGYLDMQSVSIYQSFLIMLNRANRDGSQEQGIKAVPDVDVVAYTVGATDVLANMSEISPANHTITSNYIELRNNRNLKTDLKNAYNNNRSTVAITATFMLAYNTEDDIVLQFPTRESESETTVGTKIGGSSNISADASAAAYSKMSKSAWDNTLYYCMISPSASLIYSSDDAANVNGEYYQLGINARDLTETELLNGCANMKTLGTYNVVQLRNLDEVQSMKITLTLREKGAYDTTLPIADYFKADSVVVKNHSGNAVAKSESSTEKEYVYVVNTPADVMSYDISKQLYTIPVTFSVYTGAALEARNKDYSNYMIQMQVELYDAADAEGTVIGGSSVKDHVIYTNAKLLTEVIEN